MRYQIILVSAAALIISGCNNQFTRNDPVVDGSVGTALSQANTTPPVAIVTPDAAEPLPLKEPMPADIWSDLRNGYVFNDIQHQRIETETRRLLSHEPAFNQLMSRSVPYLFYILQEVRARSMPTEIALLPAVESGFQPLARSRNGAAGLWQFMPRTGKEYDLKQDWWVDNRRDIVASTTAALDHLQYLHRKFDGDWFLALAAYNAGEGRVQRAINRNAAKGKPTDFFSLDLPRETDNYVPRLLAISRVVGNPAAYQLTLPTVENSRHFAVVNTGSQIDLRVVSELTSVPVATLLALNPGCNRAATHPDGPHRLVLPVDAIQAFETGLKQLPDEKRLRQTRHKIKSGETLSHIARKYGVSVTAIQQANKLKNSKIRAGRHLMIPLSGSPVLLANLSLPTKKSKNYKVRKGDSLYHIARRFEVKVSDLQSWNNISGARIKPGQKLIIHAGISGNSL